MGRYLISPNSFFDDRDQSVVEEFTQKLLTWYKENKRDFGWRRTRDPYKILVAEMMLQKTTSKQVNELYERFLEKFPSPSSIDKASLSEIEAELTPLGMEHKRALRFKQWAKMIIEKYEGNVPRSKEELLTLPGVGDYIANAVLCLAYGEHVPLLDTNIVRVLQRVFNLQSSKARARTDKKFWDFVMTITPSGKSRDLNLALLDHGALVCLARNPKCLICPVNQICVAYKEGKVRPLTQISTRAS